MPVPNLITICQLKGGVGKTSLATNLAGLFAAAGKRVLLVDLDQQAHCGQTFGVPEGTGRELFDSLVHGDPPVILRAVRPGLDLITGGDQIEAAAKVLTSGEKYRNTIEHMLAPLASNYDLILMDTPPAQTDLVEGVLAVAGALVVPQDGDHGTLRRTQTLSKVFVAARATNPDLRLLGMVLFGFGAGSTRIRRTFYDGVCKILGVDPAAARERAASNSPYDPAQEPVFRAVIRDSESAGSLSREDEGRLVQELADEAANARGLWRDHLKLGSPRARISSNADGLLGDYVAVARELADRLVAVRAATAEQHEMEPVS